MNNNILQKVKGLFSDSFIYGFSGVFSQLVNLFLLPIYTRYLSLGDFGVLAMLAILSSVFVPISVLGINSSIFKFYRDESVNKNKLISNALLVGFVSSIFCLIIFFIGIDFIGSVLLAKSIDYSKLLIIITLFSSAFISVSSILLSVLRSKRKPISTSLINIISLIVQISITLVFVVKYNFGIIGVTSGIFFGRLVSLLLLIIVLRKSFSINYFELNFIKKMLSYGVYSVPANLISVLNNSLGQFMLKNMININVVGIYSIALRFAMPIQLIGNSIQYAHTAVFFQTLKEKNPEDILSSMLNYFLVFISSICVFFCLFSPELLRLMTPDSFHVSYKYIAPIGFLSVLSLLYTFLSSGIDSGKNLRPYIAVNILGLFVLLVSSYILINKIGLIGSIFGSMASRFFMIFLALYYAQSRIKIHYNYILIVLILIISIFFSIIPNFIYEFSIANRLIVCVISFVLHLLVLFFTLFLFKKERIELIDIFLKLRNK